MRCAIIGVGALAALASAATAQEALLPSAGWGTGLAISGWMFNKPVAQSGGGLKAAAQVAIPFRARAIFGRWTVDLSGAGAAGAALYERVASAATSAAAAPEEEEEGDDVRVVSLFGPTDLKLRLTGPVLSENFIVTLGLNLPTGKVGLDSDETLALQALGAPALQMPIAALGTGSGATFGLVRAFEGENWAIALGGSFEQRSQYSPLAIALDTGKVETRVTPGTAMHFTLGLDRSIGEARLSALVAGDLFSADKVQLIVPSGAEGEKQFQLGPQVAVSTQLDMAGSAWRENAFTLGVRHRMEFTDSAKAKTAGSSGTYLNAGWGGVRGGPDGRGFLVGIDGRYQTGLKFTDAFIGAATTAVGGSIGWETLRASTATRVVLRGEFASFDTGKVKATGINVSLGISLGARREAQ